MGTKQSMSGANTNPTQYIQQNKETLIRLLKHSNDDFVRALALAAIVEFGDNATKESIEADLLRLREEIQDNQDGP